MINLAEDDEFKKNQCEILTEYWMKEIKSFTKTSENPCPPVILIGTHCDLFGNNNSGNHKKQLAIDKYLQLSKTISLHCHTQVFELAARKGKYSNFAVVQILQQIRIHTQEYIRGDQTFSQSGDCSHGIRYLMVRERIQKENKLLMWRNEFKKTFYSEEFKSQVSKSLKNSGVIITHRLHSSASDLVILDPILLTEAFGSIITLNSSAKHKRGYITLEEIENKFQSNKIEDKNVTKELLLIFEMFHLITKLPSGEYYVPSMIHTQASNMKYFEHKTEMIG